MGRKKKTRLSEKPLNIRLYEESYWELKQIAEREGLSDSDVHRELVAEALDLRRSKTKAAGTGQQAEGQLGATLERVEKAVAGLAGSEVPSLRQEMQNLISRVAFLSDQIALSASPSKRRKPRDKQEAPLFS